MIRIWPVVALELIQLIFSPSRCRASLETRQRESSLDARWRHCRP